MACASLRRAYVEENGKPKSYDTCSRNECRCVVKLLPHIATRDTGNESAEPHRRIEVAVCRPPVSILDKMRKVRALHAIGECRENAHKQKSND